ncbi:MAG TPA: hypothetical protein ENI74_03910 [Gammaproteobacteria bacterium]|nr:hypothetical protein [Gammaproteobacteria bacterium]
MYEQPSTPETLAWYRQGWPWFLIALPASAVIGGIATLILALQSPHALVVDDYYKEGLAINQQLHRQHAAALLGLTGLLRGDGKMLSLSMDSHAPLTTDSITLRIVHATRAELDQEITLQRQPDGRYTAKLPALRNGKWYLFLQPSDRSWEIRSGLTINGPFQAYLRPNS